MKLSELKQIIKEEIQAVLNENTPKYKKGDKLKNGLTVVSDNGYVVKAEDEKGNVRQYNYNQLKSIKGYEKPKGSVMETEEKEYKVGYWIYLVDDKEYLVLKVMASSDEEALEKAKKQKPMGSKFEIRRDLMNKS